MSWSMGCFPKQKSKHHCLTSLFGSHLPRRHSWRGRFCRFGSQSSRGCFATLVSVCMGAQGVRLMSAGIQLPDMEVQEAPLFWGSFFAACFPSHHRGQLQGPAPTTGVSRGNFAICPPPGRDFPRGNREQAAFSKKIWQITGCGLHVHAKIRTHVRNENATAWRQSPRWGWGGGNPRSLGVFRACPFCMRS